MELELKIIAIVLLSIIAMWLIRKLVEGIINFSVYRRALKDPDHPARIPNSGIVFNKRTKKLEPSGPECKIILPFNG